MALSINAIEELTEAQEKLFQDNLKYVEDAASRYRKVREDAQSIAFEQLLRAVRDYDASRGTPFKNFFWFYFSNAITNFLLKEYRSKGRSTYEEKKVMDDIKAIEETLLLSTNSVEKKELEETLLFLKNKLVELKGKTNLSLDYAPEGEESDHAKLIEMLEDAQAAAPNISEYKDLKQRIKDKLDDEDYKIMEMLEEGYTYKEIGKKLNIGRAAKVQYIFVKKILPTIQKLIYQ